MLQYCQTGLSHQNKVQFHNKNWDLSNMSASPSTKLIFLLSGAHSATVFMLQKRCKLRWNWGSDSLRFDVKAEAKCGGLFKLDREEFVCTFEPFTPLPPRCFHQPGPRVYLPTQTRTHFSTKSSFKDTQHPGAWELTLGTLKTEICEPWLQAKKKKKKGKKSVKWHLCSFVFILN